MRSFIPRAAFVALGACLLSGCIDSAKPILTDSKPLLGQHLRLQTYSLDSKGVSDGPEQAEYVWKGSYYAHVSGGMKDVPGFTVHPFEHGDYIVQTRPSGSDKTVDYALLHPFVAGVYQAVAIDENDATAAVRAANCETTKGSSCRVETRAQLWALARATAARPKDRGGLAIKLPFKQSAK
ncbi:MAG: hypothetical protein WCA36_07050 [Pseudolabrys sp.]